MAHDKPAKLDIDTLSKLTGVQFHDVERLERALTHSSVPVLAGKKAANYERLEFLGDRVLGLVIAELLCELYPQADEGELSVRLNALVNAETCAEIADEIGITPHIITGPEIASASAAKLVNLRGDVMEAVIATVYLDSGTENGLASARQFIRRFWNERALIGAAIRRDPKTELQEWAHKAHAAQPAYNIVSRNGPDHQPVFTIEVRVKDLSATATGASKRDAERAAAARILKTHGVWSET
ncbi:MAG: ribonuclease III [Notoacmeibacter sp.]